MENVTYAEAYAGGAGSAINLLLSNRVNSILINDANIGIYSFWQYLKNESDNFLDLVHNTEVNLEVWQQQRRIFKSATKSSLQLGFATFYLSRTNRSGILGAGPIGGQDPVKQGLAKHKLDCRFNKLGLIEKLEKIIEKKERIFVYNDDALDFLAKIDSKNTLVYLDPPYYEQGKALYMNYYKHENHVDLQSFLDKTNCFKWILSYDNVEPIRRLYSKYNLFEFNLSYTAQDSKQG